MRGTAFCPAHVTGFFKAEIGGRRAAETGSLGAGFCIQDGVTTSVRAGYAGEPGSSISISGYGSDDTRVSEHVIGEFSRIVRDRRFFVDVRHEIAVPVGYGLGCSGAVALSLAMALNEALGTDLTDERVAGIAHGAEVACRTGLGDVLAAFHGGFEVRIAPGAPGTGRVERTESDARALLICFSPISTRRFIGERIGTINGLGGRMVSRLVGSMDRDDFQDMSLEFARHVGIMTPRMDSVARDLRDGGIKCGVALFGETVFTLVPDGTEADALRILGRHGGIVIRSKIDNAGARLQ